eukprot:TRINITY_DN5210_c0_g2_i3.p1 TRINITY_DN5210_c0_g2~~TRINITY_DN5210_c0_g2_i3.p1  ORF type:complete len:301 (+),score=9.48 TRINITY_DN5210_c0_g2_i3:157-1059(+)
MFFGGMGGFGPRQRRGQRVNTRTYYANGQNQGGQGGNRQAQGNRGLIQLIQFMPLILIFLSSVFFNMNKSEPVYSLSRTANFRIERHTERMNIAYYVDANFASKYAGKPSSIKEVENDVETNYINWLANRCEISTEQKRRLEYQARFYGGGERARLTQMAENVDMSACNEWRRLVQQYNVRTRYSYGWQEKVPHSRQCTPRLIKKKFIYEESPCDVAYIYDCQSIRWKRVQWKENNSHSNNNARDTQALEQMSLKLSFIYSPLFFYQLSKILRFFVVVFLPHVYCALICFSFGLPLSCQG